VRREERADHERGESGAEGAQAEVTATLLRWLLLNGSLGRRDGLTGLRPGTSATPS
jgi:hypothetical protein